MSREFSDVTRHLPMIEDLNPGFEEALNEKNVKTESAIRHKEKASLRFMLTIVRPFSATILRPVIEQQI